MFKYKYVDMSHYNMFYILLVTNCPFNNNIIYLKI